MLMKVHSLLPGMILLITACVPVQIPQQQPMSQTGAVTSVASSSQKQVVIPRTISGALVLGSDDAPVTMLLFTNHHCEYCRQFEEEVLPRLFYDFTGRGLLSIHIISLPLRKYPTSERDAKILICGAQSATGTVIHRELFEGKTVFPSLKNCLDDANGDLAKIYATQQQLIQSLNVTLVPTYFLNQTRYTGLPSYADVRGQIEEALER
jgi:protein-disulfide isomerase